MFNIKRNYVNVSWVCLVLGYTSGLPLNFSDFTLKSWYSAAGIDVVTIGYLSIVGFPYALKFLWAPLFDRYVAPFAGRRRGWIVFFQALLLLTLVIMAFMPPTEFPVLLFICACLLTFFSASQDIVVDAYRTELLLPRELGVGAAFALGGYRLGMLVSGGIALILASYVGWTIAYIALAMTLILGIICALIAPEPDLNVSQPVSLKAAISEPIAEYMGRSNAWLVIIFIISYKLGDAFLASLSQTFLIQALAFSLAEVGVATKIFGIIAIIIGIGVGGFLLTVLGLYRSLFLFAILQALSNLLFYALALIGHNLYFMNTTIFAESLFVGMGNAALVAFIMALCNKRYTATQFALLSAVAAVARLVVGPVSGYLVIYLGWAQFYFWTFIFALPTLAILILLRRESVFQLPLQK